MQETTPIWCPWELVRRLRNKVLFDKAILVIITYGVAVRTNKGTYIRVTIPGLLSWRLLGEAGAS